MATGWGVERANDKGFDTASARQINAAEYSVGVLRGCKISTSSTNLTYKVSRGSDPASIAVGSATAADGAVIFPVPDGLTTGAVAAGDPTNPRIDSVFAVQHDAAAGDADNQVVLVAVSGTPAASPTEPAAPAGIAVRLASFTVPKSASTTSQATPYGSVTYSIPYGASLGRIGYNANTVTTQQAYDGTWYVQAAVSVSLSTDRLVDVRWTGRASSTDQNVDASYYVKLVVDNVDQSDGLDEINVPANWERKQFVYSAVLPAGVHTVTVAAKCDTNKPAFIWQGIRTVEVFDRGVSA